MFTGLVEDVGTVVRADHRPDALMLAIRPDLVPATQMVIGESVCHDGVCLTVTEVGPAGYQVLAGAETLARTTLGLLRVGSRVNLERALAAGARLGGHLVAGHVDGVGEVTARRDEGGNVIYTVRAAGDLLRYVVEKGSIAIDGISLTVNRVDPPGPGGTFDVAIIPHTAQATTLADKHVGRRVNVEVDVIGKYVERLLGGYQGAAS
jgi:riboflavin synthase